LSSHNQTHERVDYFLKNEEAVPLGAVSRKPEKPFVKLRPAYSVKLVYSNIVKGIKIKITAKFHASRRLRFEDTKKTVTRNAPEKLRDFQETGPCIGQERRKSLRSHFQVELYQLVRQEKVEFSVRRLHN